MSITEQIQIFEDKQIRTVWDDEQEKWFFSVVDVVGVLTDSVNPTDYLKKMRKREPELGIYLGTNCPQVLMTTPTGRNRNTLAGTTEHIFRQRVRGQVHDPALSLAGHVPVPRPSFSRIPNNCH